MDQSIAIFVVIGAFVLATILQIVITKRSVSQGKSFVSSATSASVVAFIFSIAVVLGFLAIGYLVRR